MIIVSAPSKEFRQRNALVDGEINYAESDGIVEIYGTPGDLDMYIYVDTFSPPTTVMRRQGAAGAEWASSSCRVRKGEYWKTENGGFVVWVPFK